MIKVRETLMEKLLILGKTSPEKVCSLIQKLKKFQKKYAAKIKRAELIRAPIERAWNIYERQLIEYRAFYAKDEINNANLSTKIVRTLEVNNFGFVTAAYLLTVLSICWALFAMSQRVMVLFKEIKDEKLYEPEIDPLAK